MLYPWAKERKRKMDKLRPRVKVYYTKNYQEESRIEDQSQIKLAEPQIKLEPEIKPQEDPQIKLEPEIKLAEPQIKLEPQNSN